MKLARYWFTFLAIAGVIPAIAAAQPPQTGSGIVGIAHIAFRVSNLDREAAFFGQLGYEEAFPLTNNGKVTQIFIKVNDRQFIELYPQTDPAQPLGWMHVCYEAGDLDQLQKFYVSEGLNAAPVRKASAGNLISSLNDPEGRVTEFLQYMPGSRHMLDRGQHLGPDRLSTVLMGFDIPVKEGAAMKEFYTDLGFEAAESSGNVHLTAPGAPEVHLTLRPASPGAKPQILLPVPDARRAQAKLESAGVAAERNGKILMVHDPDGNQFVFLEMGEKR